MRATVWIATWTAMFVIAALVSSDMTEEADGSPGTTYTVTNGDDPGNGFCDAQCTLREAIMSANADPGATVAFNISGCVPGGCTISVGSELPYITGTGTTIDGTTQPGYLGTPFVTIDGAITGASGLTVFADNVTIKGLVIQNFSGPGVDAAQGITGHINKRVEDNIVRDNGQAGILLNGDNGAIVDNTISGNGDNGVQSYAAVGLLIADNEVSGNGGAGVESSATNTTLTGNSISGNAHEGADVGGDGASVATGNVVTNNPDGGLIVFGDTIAVSGNTATGNGFYGIFVGGAGGGSITDNVITGNGPLATPGGEDGSGLRLGGLGTRFIFRNEVSGNAGHGMYVSSPGNIIGGQILNDANLITSNGGSGIFLYEEGTEGNSIAGNRIYANGDLGIDIVPADVTSDGVTPNDPLDSDTGVNGLQNFPELVAATSGSLTLTGDFNSNPLTEFRIEVFHNESCDTSGFGEGQESIGAIFLTTDAAGNAMINESIADAPVSGFVTATALNLDSGNTSEFSNCIPIEAAPTPTASATPNPSPTPTATPTPTPAPTGPTPTPTPTGGGQQVAWGDHNCSTSVDPVDGLLNLRHDAGLPTDTGNCPDMGDDVNVQGDGTHPWGDLDCSGVADPVDGLKVLRFDAGLDVARPNDCPDPGETVTIS